MGLEIINKLKKKKGLTSEQLSKESGVPLGTLNKILNGTTKDPKLETLKALARVLDCSLDDFDDNPKKKTIKGVDTIAAHLEGKDITPQKMKLLEKYIDALFENED
ncbi:helix-turn-helix domain-containing protein [Clostridium sp. WILCCON 0269]|uniref:Helix-turn-helix domain-containing protein n=1 Tax=Candidatus Clostridium eludens TaxID=3381663 RepID=A0ABW8SE10_9CLOT